nr:MAG TPA: Membrane bound YbgT-like protein [Caudoviricetes sp.]
MWYFLCRGYTSWVYKFIFFYLITILCGIYFEKFRLFPFTKRTQVRIILARSDFKCLKI